MRRLRCLLALTALTVLAALLPAASAVAEEPPWRFGVLRSPVPATKFVQVAGGADLAGDGVDDLAVSLAPSTFRGLEDAVAAVVSGAERDSWVAGRGPADLVIRGVRDGDGLPVPLCKPGILPDLSGDGIAELLLQLCPEDPQLPRRLFVVYGTAAGGETRLDALEGRGFEIDLGLAAGEVVRSLTALEDVGGRAGLAVSLTLAGTGGSETRVYQLVESGVEPWVAYEALGFVRSAGRFFPDGGSGLLVIDSGPADTVLYAVRVPSSPSGEVRSVRDLGEEEAVELAVVGDDPDGRRLGIGYSAVGDLDGDGFDDVAVSSRTVRDEYVFGQSMVLGGPAAPDGSRRSFRVRGSRAFPSGDPSVPVGDLNGDGIDDLLINNTEGFHVLYGSRTVEDVDLAVDGGRSVFVEAPAPVGLFGVRLAAVGGGAERAPRVAAIGELALGRDQSRSASASGELLYVFEPPGVPPRRGVAFDGDPLTVGRVDGDPAEVPEAGAAGEAAAVARALAVSRRAFPGSRAEHVVVASAGSYADALAATPLLGGGPLLLTPPEVLPEAVAGEIDRVLAPDATVYVMGGQAAVSETVTAAAVGCRDPRSPSGDHCYRVRRLAGGSRVETAAAVARLVGPTLTGRVAVARAYGTADASGAEVVGSGWADAVTAGGWAAATRTPVLLTPSEELHPAVAGAVADLGVTSTAALGGTAAVSDAVAAQLPGAFRVAGSDRSETAVRIVGLWPFDTPRRRVLVDGYRADGWTAGLPAAALAADAGAPILLSQGGQLPEATAAALRPSCEPDPAYSPPESQPVDVVLVGPPPDDGPDPLPDAVVAAQRC